MRHSAVILGLILSTGCGGTTPPAPIPEIRDLPATVTLTVGEERAVRGAIVRFVEVKNDSRCPSDVQCVWAGNAEVVVSVGPAAGLGPVQLVTLNTTLEPKSGSAQGLIFTIQKLDPAPVSTTPTRDYRAEILIAVAPPS